MRTSHTLTALLLAGPLAIACAKPKATAADLHRMNQEFAAAINARDAAKAASLYTVDAVIMPPNGDTVRGREAIQAYWQHEIEGGVTDVSVHSLATSSEGTLGYEVGAYHLAVKPPSGPPLEDRGKYVELLRREPDGVWRSIVGIWNSDLPAAGQ